MDLVHLLLLSAREGPIEKVRFWIQAILVHQMDPITSNGNKLRLEEIFLELNEAVLVKDMLYPPQTRDDFLFWAWYHRKGDSNWDPFWKLRESMLNYHFEKASKIEV